MDILFGKVQFYQFVGPTVTRQISPNNTLPGLLSFLNARTVTDSPILFSRLVRHHHSNFLVGDVPPRRSVSNPYRRVRSQTARVTHDREIPP